MVEALTITPNYTGIFRVEIITMVNICWNLAVWWALCYSAGMVHLLTSTASWRGACYYHPLCSRWGNWGQKKLSNLSKWQRCDSHPRPVGGQSPSFSSSPSFLLSLEGGQPRAAPHPGWPHWWNFSWKFLSPLNISFSPFLPWNLLQV